MVNQLESDTSFIAMIYIAQESTRLKRIGMRFIRPDPSDYYGNKLVPTVVEKTNKALGVIGRLEHIRTGDFTETWFWEASEGTFLNTRGWRSN